MLVLRHYDSLIMIRLSARTNNQEIKARHVVGVRRQSKIELGGILAQHATTAKKKQPSRSLYPYGLTIIFLAALNLLSELQIYFLS